ncbi:MAG TPA: hypothetical protein VHS26_04575 [Solirubrobacteraceae bacterium]|nr:hypothetical protein [Solirubrobacteraceae bacterium]
MGERDGKHARAEQREGEREQPHAALGRRRWNVRVGTLGTRRCVRGARGSVSERRGVVGRHGHKP